MSSDKKGLGTTPSAGKQDVSFILQGGAPSSAFEIQQIPLSLIDESDSLRLRQPPYRDVIKLAEEIKRFGQTTPLFVRPNGNRYDLISGYRRFSALQHIEAPAALARIYRNLSPSQAYDLAISENQDRESLTDLERAEICLRLQKEGRTIDQIALRMGWSGDRQVFRHLKLAKEAPASLREELQARRIYATVAVGLLEDGIRDLPEMHQREVLRTIAENEMSLRDARACLARTKKILAGAVRLQDPVEETQDVYIHEYKNGAFAVSAKIDPRKPEQLEKAIASLETALKRAKSLKKKLEKQILETAYPSGDGSSVEESDEVDATTAGLDS